MRHITHRDVCRRLRLLFPRSSSLLLRSLLGCASSVPKHMPWDSTYTNTCPPQSTHIPPSQHHTVLMHVGVQYPMPSANSCPLFLCPLLIIEYCHPLLHHPLLHHHPLFHPHRVPGAPCGCKHVLWWTPPSVVTWGVHGVHLVPLMLQRKRRSYLGMTRHCWGWCLQAYLWYVWYLQAYSLFAGVHLCGFDFWGVFAPKHCGCLLYHVWSRCLEVHPWMVVVSVAA